MIIRFFRTSRPKTFNYIPRYYDEQKEELEKRVERIKQEMGVSNTEGKYVPNIKGQFRRQHEKNAKTRKQSNFRVVLIFLFIILLIYWLFFR